MAQLKAVVHQDIEAEALPNERFREAYRFWLDLKGDRELPHDSQISLTNLPAGKASRYAIIGVEGMPRRYHYRLLGSMVTRAWGEDFSGRYADEMPNGHEMIERMELCVKSRKPYYSQGPLKYAVFDFRSFEVLVMPFADQDNAVSKLLVYNEFV